MKRTTIAATPALLISNGTANAFTEQECEKVWSKEAWAQAKQVPQPDFTCVRITEHLLVSLQGATKAQVIKAMKANGKPFSDKYDILHFLSIPDGPANFTFENDKVVHIYGNVDSSKEFSWGNTGPDVPYACSDLSGSRYPRCDKK
jgi:hypothetical protein